MADQFVTVFFGVLDGATGQLVYANAGKHNGLLFCLGGRSNSGQLQHHKN